MGLELSGLTAKLVGIDGFKFGVYSGAVKVNKMTKGTTAPGTPVKKDWSTFTETSDTAPIPEEFGDVLRWAKQRWDAYRGEYKAA